uniref:Neurobeachin n=1 Tax=Ascaris lumbricoides TaxID=6252 RepID=A0A0M3IVC4_ASCLU
MYLASDTAKCRNSLRVNYVAMLVPMMHLASLVKTYNHSSCFEVCSLDSRLVATMLGNLHLLHTTSEINLLLTFPYTENTSISIITASGILVKGRRDKLEIGAKQTSGVKLL